MTMPESGGAPRADAGGRSAEWLTPVVEQPGLKRYLGTLRSRWWLVLLAVVVATGAAAAYSTLAPKVYKAQASLLVSPVAPDNPAFAGLSVIRDSSDPTRDVETASQLVTTPQVAALAQRTLHSSQSPRKLLARVSVQPVAQSNIVSITARGDSPASATQLANAFARAAVQERTTALHAQVDAQIASLRNRIAAAPLGVAALRRQLGQLETLRLSADPTINFTSPAEPPTGPSSPKRLLSIVVGLVAGLILGLAAVFGLQVLDPRLRREEQVREEFQLPILARIPKESRSRTKEGLSLGPQELSAASREAYRTLRGTVAALGATSGRSRCILVTSPTAAEGKSTTAINLASAFVIAGKRVVLIEADLRRPSIARTLGARAPHGIGSVLLGNVKVADALGTARPYGPFLGLLLADELGPGSASMADRLSLPLARKLIDEARKLADYVIIDSPPLSEVLDALPLAQEADDVLVVVRMNRTPLTKLTRLGELLARHDIRPAGFAIVGVPTTSADAYPYYESGAATSRNGRVPDAAVDVQREDAQREPAS